MFYAINTFRISWNGRLTHCVDLLADFREGIDNPNALILESVLFDHGEQLYEDRYAWDAPNMRKILTDMEEGDMSDLGACEVKVKIALRYWMPPDRRWLYYIYKIDMRQLARPWESMSRELHRDIADADERGRGPESDVLTSILAQVLKFQQDLAAKEQRLA